MPSSWEKQRERTVPSASSTQAQMQPTCSASGRSVASSTASASSSSKNFQGGPHSGRAVTKVCAAVDPHLDLARGRPQHLDRLPLFAEQPGGADARVPGEAELERRA